MYIANSFPPLKNYRNSMTEVCEKFFKSVSAAEEANDR